MQLKNCVKKQSSNPHYLNHKHVQQLSNVSKVQMRHDILQSQERANYIHEYARIVGMMANTQLHGLRSMNHLANRKDELKRLAIASMNIQQHDILD